MIPCEECPVLAMCRHKRIIECDVLWRSDTLSHKDMFKRAKVVLPKLEGVQTGDLIVTAKRPHYHIKKESMKWKDIR